MYQKLIYLFFTIGCLITSSCEEEKQPNNFAPEIRLEEVEEITRTSAILTGRIISPQASNTDRCCFRYGSTPAMETRCEIPFSNEQLRLKIDHLLAGTTYYYCLEAGNASEWLQSEPSSFTTIPNDPPTVGEMQLLGQGPTSILMSCKLIDNGGEPITRYGFSYQAKGQQEEKEVEVEVTNENQWKVRINGLQKMTEYTIRGYAENRFGKSYSKSFTFQTGNAVTLLNAGTLEDIIGREFMHEYESLSIIGPLNGSDFRFIRAMSGKAYDGSNTTGILKEINLTDAEIVEGGVSYDDSRHTQKNTVSYGMFSHLDQLKSVQLPQTTNIIERNAFKNCKALKSIEIPAAVTSFSPSEGCISLSTIRVSPANTLYKSISGVLYNHNGENMLWYPEGMVADEIQWSDKLKKIDDFALQHCKVRKIVLPASIQSIGKQAFAYSQIEEIVLPDQIRQIPHALFQHCERLRCVTLGKNCEILSSYCFDQCPLEHLYVRSLIPPVCETNTFKGLETRFLTCRIHVQENSVSLYRNHEHWLNFLYIKGDL